MAKNNSVDSNDSLGDSLTVTSEKGGKGDYGWSSSRNGNNDKSSSNSGGLLKRDPNSAITFHEVSIDTGEIIEFTAIGLTMIDPSSNKPVIDLTLESKQNANSENNKQRGKKQKERTKELNIPVVRQHPFSLYDKGIKFTPNNKTSFQHYNYKYDVELDENGKVKNIKETLTDNYFKGTDKLRFFARKEEGRKEFIKNKVELTYSLRFENVRNYKIGLKEYTYEVEINNLGIITELKKSFKKAKSHYFTRKNHQDNWYKENKLTTEDERDKTVKKIVNTTFNSHPNNKKKVAEKEKSILLDTSAIITDASAKISKHLGDKYNDIANELKNDIKNFQGKRIRSFDEAMKTMNKVISNPNAKLNKADRNAVANAIRYIDAKTLSDNLQRLGKSFALLDKVIKVEKIRDKIVEGFEAGNWKPLMLEIEAMVLSGFASGILLGILTSIAMIITAKIAIPATILKVVFIIITAILTSYIDDKFADKLNNYLIPSVH